MNHQLHLNPAFNYYLLFYLIGFAAAYLVILVRILKLKGDKAILFTVTSLIFLTFVFGCKLVPLLEHVLLPENSTMATDAKSQMAIGGITLSLLFILSIRKMLKLPDDYWYSIGLALIAGLIIQKPGCLLGGCCRGIATSYTFGIMYMDEILRHPLQIYEGLLYLLVLAFAVLIKAKRKDSMYFWVISAYCFIQFGLEFLRVSEDTAAFRNIFLGLKTMQWKYLLVALWTAYLGIKNENQRHKAEIPFKMNSSITQAVLFIVAVLAFYMIHDWLYPSEIIAINLAFIPALAFTIVRVHKSMMITRYRWATLSSLIFPLVLMGQTMKTNIETEQDVYKTVAVGYSGGTFDYFLSNSQDPGNCTANTYRTDYTQKYNAITIGFSITKIRDNESLTYGFDGTYGQITETDQQFNTNTSYTLGYLSPYINYDNTWVGIGAGLHLGSIYFPPTKATKQGNSYTDSGLNQTPLLPRFRIRAGPTRFIFTEYGFANNFPTALPAITHELSLGSGFGIKSGFYIKYGAIIGSQSYYGEGSYLKGYIPIESKVVLEPMIGLGTMKNVYMLGASYRFGHKKTTYTLSGVK